MSSAFGLCGVIHEAAAQHRTLKSESSVISSIINNAWENKVSKSNGINKFLERFVIECGILLLFLSF